MAKNITQALDNVEMTYSQVVDIANDMIRELTSPVTNIINEISDNINALSNEQIRDYILRLQLRAYELSETKDKSALKATLAESLRDEKYAQVFNESDGTAAVKQNVALLGASEETVVQSLYELIADTLKTKQDQVHRMIDSLKSILVSRMQEAKLSAVGLD